MKEVAVVKKFAVVALFAFAVLFVPRTVSADEINQATKVTFSQPVQIPGQTLPPGTYIFELANSGSGRDLVRIFNADQTQVIATIFTTATTRRDLNPKTEVTLAEQGDGQPQAVFSWFFLDNTTGREFIYPKQTYEQLARAKHDTFPEGD